VLIGRAPRHQLADVVVGTDGSEHGDRALELAAELPLPASTLYTVTHVMRRQSTLFGLLAIEVERLYERLHDAEQTDRNRATALVARGRNLLQSCGKRGEQVVRTGDPASEILAEIEDRMADLVIVGARGVSRIEGLLTGSVADRLLAEAKCSVLLARPHLETEAAR
jgi:nucleotide-binding universal stress UspA family protein